MPYQRFCAACKKLLFVIEIFYEHNMAVNSCRELPVNLVIIKVSLCQSCFTSSSSAASWHEALGGNFFFPLNFSFSENVFVGSFYDLN